MSKSNTAETDYLNLFYLKTLPAILGTLSGTGNTHWYLSLHTADPGEGGDQTTSEATYTGYARIDVIRTAAGWSVSGNTATNVALIQWPLCTGGSNTVTYIGVGSASSGAGVLELSGAFASSLAVSNNIRPQVDPSGYNHIED